MNKPPSSRGRLPRLQRESYRGFVSVHWIFCLEARATGWLGALFHARFREIMVHACSRHGCVCAVYCLMPDHIHVMLSGVSEEADLYLAGRFLRKHLKPALSHAKFQKQGYDHVLRKEERRDDAFAKICHYILENPVRADLCGVASGYDFSGGVIPGFPDLCVHDREYWELYWRIHHRLTTAATSARSGT